MLLIYDRYKLRWEQYKEYDPFLDGAGSTPSNHLDFSFNCTTVE
jgi:hypothetical protein